MDSLEIKPAERLSGVTPVAADKSISHRLAMIAAIAEGATTIHNFAESVDCQSTLECLRNLGVKVERTRSSLTIHGRGLHGLEPPPQALDAGNSGTTVRLMSGLLAGCRFESTFVGDESLSRRPMKRIIDPLRQFGATIEARDGNYLPLKILGRPLNAIDFTLPIPRAEVKSCVLLAGLQAQGVTITQLAVRNGEPVGDVCAESSDIAGMDSGGSWIPNIIDEIPILAVLGTRTQNGIRFRDAAELRAKESDRIHAVARNLRALGAAVEEYPDGLFVPGGQRLHGAAVDSFGDHRIAMAFAIAGLFADGPVVIKDPACVSISFPAFFDLLNRVRV